MCSKPYHNGNNSQERNTKNVVDEKRYIAGTLRENANGTDNSFQIKTVACCECGIAIAFYFINDSGILDRNCDSSVSDIRPLMCNICAENIIQIAELLELPISVVPSINEIVFEGPYKGYDRLTRHRWHYAILRFVLDHRKKKPESRKI